MDESGEGDLEDSTNVKEVSSQDLELPEAENNLSKPATVTATATTSTSTGAGRGRTYRPTFKVNWLKMFPWLDFENNLIFCKYCRGQKQAGNSLFVSEKSTSKKRYCHKTLYLEAAYPV